MMTVQELQASVRIAQWFARLGTFPGGKGLVPIRSLDAWSDENAASGPPDLADDMEWLPTTIDGDDPVHGDRLRKLLKGRGLEEQAKRASVDLHKETLLSLRRMTPQALLRVTPHDFTNAARGAALYAVRHAALEIFAEEQKFWTRLVPLYAAGHWPLGLLRNGDVVVL